MPTSPAGPLPEVTFTDLVVRHGDDEDEWIVLGMAHNESSSALESVAVCVELVDAAGTATSEATAPLPLSVLQPGAASPFIARLEQAESPAEVRASLESFQFSSAAGASTSLGAVYTTQAPDEVFVRGTVQCEDTRPVRVHDVVIVWRATDRSLAGLAVASVPGAILPQSGSLPWIAQASGATPGTRFEVFTAVSAVDPASEIPLVVTDGPTWHVTSQGNGFATGAIRNAGDAPVLPQVAIAVRAAGRPISLEILQSIIPLEPGETLTFAADRFPGLQAALESGGIEIADVTLEAYLDAQPVPLNTGGAVILPVSIHQLEAIGSSIFLRGTVSNPDSVPLRSAAIFVSLRSTTGEPQSARWLELAPPPAEAGVEFSLDMPLSADINPAMCEYDIRAFGLPLPDSSW
ncbi:MAG: hypothetical protein NTU91_17155 [Chloroflexi bacterium]|nr:hypothetical protein [Chloroflexota bacterium]